MLNTTNWRRRRQFREEFRQAGKPGLLPLFGQARRSGCYEDHSYPLDLGGRIPLAAIVHTPPRQPMLKITLHDSADELRLRLEGKLCGPWVGELRQCWRTASSTTEGRRTVLDLRDVDFVDGEGQILIADMRDQGVYLLAETPLIQSLIEEAPAFNSEMVRNPAGGCVRG